MGSFQEHHGSRGRSRCEQESSFSVPLLMKLTFLWSVSAPKNSFPGIIHKIAVSG